MGRRLAAIAVIIVAIFLSASARAGYRHELSAATKEGKIYDPTTWEARLIWHATFFGDDFRKNFEKHHLRITHITGEDAAVFLEEQDRRQATGWTFFVTMYTKEPYKKFTAFEDSFWKIRLTTGSGESLTPTSVEAFPVDPYALEMFPFVDRWSKIYRVVFPKAPLGDRIDLTLTSVVGESTVTWKFRPEEGTPSAAEARIPPSKYRH